MAWISIDDMLPDHHKTARLRALLGLDTKREAVGYTVMLFLYTFKVAWRDGDLSAYGEKSIEEACEWKGKHGVLVKAFNDCGKPGPDGKNEPGFMVGLVVNDWIERMSKLINDRIYREEQRTGKYVKATPESSEVLEAWNVYAKQHGLPQAMRPPRLPQGITPGAFAMILAEAASQSFLHGGGPKGWRMSLDWLLKDGNLAKVAAGQYADRKSAQVATIEDPLAEARKKSRELIAKRKKELGLDA